MRSVEEALAAILEGLAPLPAESVPLGPSLGRALAEPPRPRADDSQAGDTVLAAGSEVTPAAIAVAASCGLDVLAVRRRPRVAIVSTGDELATPGAPLSPGAIYDANGPGLAAAVREAGGEPLEMPRAADRLADVEALLRRAAAGSDLVITSGGVSVGRHDVIRAAIERIRRLEFWR